MSSDHCARLHFVYVHPHSAADVSSAVCGFFHFNVCASRCQVLLHLFGTVEMMSFSYTSNLGNLSYVGLTFSYSQIRIV